MPHRLFVKYAISILLLILVSVVSAQEAAPEAHKAIIQQVYDDVFNAGDLALMDSIYAPDYVNYGFEGDLTLDGFKAAIGAMRSALPDFAATVEVLIAENDWAASRVVFGGTFENEWVMADQTIAPNGERVEWSLNILHRFNEDGQLAEDFTAFDSLSLLIKLGASPVPSFIADILITREYVPAVMGETVSEAMLDIHKNAFMQVIDYAIGDGDLAVIDTYMDEAYLTHEPFGDFTREQFRQIIAAFRAAVPDLDVTADAVVAEGDWLAAKVIYTGTFSNAITDGLTTLEATNEPIKFVINVFVRYNEDGIGIEDFKEYNRLGWLRQLGILPATS